MGLDLARALAVIGMAGAHMGGIGEINIWYPETYFGVVHGRSSILFAVLAGISVAIMTGRQRIPERAELGYLRSKLFVRGILIFIIGLLLEQLGVPVAIILMLYGLLYIIVMPFLRMRVGTLLLVACVIAVVGSMVTMAFALVFYDVWAFSAEFLSTDAYPLSIWVPLMLVGLAIGRLPLLDNRVSGALFAIGAGVSVIAYSLSAAAGGAEGHDGPLAIEAYYDGDDRGVFWPWIWGSLVASYPHSGGMLEFFGSGGFAVAVIGLCLLIAKPLRWPLIPLAALGSMPLTAYSAHLVVIVIGWGPGALPDSYAAWGWTSLGLVVGCTLYMVFFGRGPLERGLKWVSDAAAKDRAEESTPDRT